MHPRVRHGAEPLGARTVVDVLELLGRVAGLARVEPHSGDVLAVGHRRVECGDRLALGKVAQEAQDQLRRDRELLLGLCERPLDPVDDGAHRDSARGMGLRIEEDLGVTHALRVGASQVRHRQVEEVGLLHQHRTRLVVDVQERLEVGKHIGTLDRLHIRVRQSDVVAAGEREHELWFERAFDVEVQLRFG